MGPRAAMRTRAPGASHHRAPVGIVPAMSERKKPLLTLRLDLGIGALIPVWRSAWSRATLREDTLAGLAAVGLRSRSRCSWRSTPGCRPPPR
jgi:hypothetical protein